MRIDRTLKIHDDSYLEFGVRIRELLDEHFDGKDYCVSLRRKTAKKPQYKPNEYESYEIWIAKRTGVTTSAQMATGIIYDSKTVLKILTVSGIPRPGFDNRYVIWHPDDGWPSTTSRPGNTRQRLKRSSRRLLTSRHIFRRSSHSRVKLGIQFPIAFALRFPSSGKAVWRQRLWAQPASHSLV